MWLINQFSLAKALFHSLCQPETCTVLVATLLSSLAFYRQMFWISEFCFLKSPQKIQNLSTYMRIEYVTYFELCDVQPLSGNGCCASRWCWRTPSTSWMRGAVSLYWSAKQTFNGIFLKSFFIFNDFFATHSLASLLRKGTCCQPSKGFWTFCVRFLSRLFGTLHGGCPSLWTKFVWGNGSIGCIGSGGTSVCDTTFWQSSSGSQLSFSKQLCDVGCELTDETWQNRLLPAPAVVVSFTLCLCNWRCRVWTVKPSCNLKDSDRSNPIVMLVRNMSIFCSVNEVIFGESRFAPLLAALGDLPNRWQASNVRIAPCENDTSLCDHLVIDVPDTAGKRWRRSGDSCTVCTRRTLWCC